MLLQTEAESLVDEPSMPEHGGWRSLSGDYWIFFSAAFFFDAGFAVYFFLFNLFLLDLHFNERAIGLIASAFTFGSTLATLPAGLLVQRKGVRWVLALCFITAPALGIVRLYSQSLPFQIVLAFCTGAAMCLWGVGYLPAVAGLTNASSRATGYSLIFSASIVTGAIGSFVSSRAPLFLRTHSYLVSTVMVKRDLLVGACFIAALGLLPVLKLKKFNMETQQAGWLESLRRFRPSPFLVRYLPCMALWSGVIAAFMAFGNVYLVHSRHVSFETVGTTFAVTQVLQLGLGVSTPTLLKRVGILRGVLIIQVGAMICLSLLTLATGLQSVLCTFVVLSALLWMGSPALYSLMMNGVEECQRNAAASMTLFYSSVASTIAIAVSGVMLKACGYQTTFLTLALVGTCCAIALYLLLRPFLSEA